MSPTRCLSVALCDADMTFSAHPRGAARRLAGLRLKGRPVFVQSSHGHQAAGNVGEIKKCGGYDGTQKRWQLGNEFPRGVGVAVGKASPEGMTLTVLILSQFSETKKVHCPFRERFV